ncbi:hypothetical protein C347_04652 [Cryptococcus neoformans AD2-60a]|nr:hypothetical protein C347_04652 [Cryptococcus neoformans var. grubii AD2-60a]
MEEDGKSTWQDWSVAFKAKAMPSHWEYRESRTLFHLSLPEVSPNAWRKFDDAVILHRSHLHVDEPGFHSNDLDGLRVLIGNHIERIAHEDAASQHAPRSIKNPAFSTSRSSDSAQLPQPVTYYHDPTHPLPYYRSPAGQYIRDVFRRENRCFDCCKTGHKHAQCPSHTHHTPPKVNQLETELTAGDATSAYLALAQTIPSAAEPVQDSSYALFYPLLAISVPILADDLWPAHPIRLLIDTGASTTFVDPMLAARLGWSVKTGAVWMRVRLAGRKVT